MDESTQEMLQEIPSLMTTQENQGLHHHMEEEEVIPAIWELGQIRRWGWMVSLYVYIELASTSLKESRLKPMLEGDINSSVLAFDPKRKQSDFICQVHANISL